MKRRRTRVKIVDKNFRKLYGVNPQLADFLRNLSSGGAGGGSLTTDLEVTNEVGVATGVYLEGTPLEDIIRDILSGEVAAGFTVLTNENESGVSIGTGPFMPTTDEKTIAQLDYRVSDPSGLLEPNSTSVTFGSGASVNTLLSGQPNEDGVAYDDVAYPASYTVGSDASDYPYNYTGPASQKFNLRVEAQQIGGGTPANKTVSMEFVTPIFCIPIKALPGFNNPPIVTDPQEPWGTGNWISIEATFETTWNSLASFRNQGDENLVFNVSGTSDFSTVDFQFSPGSNIPEETPFQIQGFFFVFGVPVSHAASQGTLKVTQAGQQLTSVSPVITVNYNLRADGIIPNAPDLYQTPYKLFYLTNVNSMQGAEPIQITFS